MKALEGERIFRFGPPGLIAELSGAGWSRVNGALNFPAVSLAGFCPAKPAEKGMIRSRVAIQSGQEQFYVEGWLDPMAYEFFGDRPVELAGRTLLVFARKDNVQYIISIAPV